MTPLEKFKKRSINVSDIAAQFWCEKKLELSYIYGKEKTENQNRGQQLHEELEKEIEQLVAIEPITFADNLFIKFFNLSKSLETLNKENVAREIPIFGSINGFFITGQIDELRKKDGKVFIIETKTRSMPNLPGDFYRKIIKVQLFLYKKILDDTLSGRFSLNNIINFYKLDKMNLSEEFKRQLDGIGVAEKELVKIAREAYSDFMKLDEISNMLKVEYFDQYTGKYIGSEEYTYNEKQLEEWLKFAFDYWKGKREAMPVPREEAPAKCLKCKFFGKECKTWFLKI